MKIKKLRVESHDDKNYKLVVEATFPIEDDELGIDYVQRAVRNNKWLLEQLVSFRRWDQSYDYELISKMFEEKAHYFLNEGHLVRSCKTGRILLHLAKRFEKLANEDTVPKHLRWGTKSDKRFDLKLANRALGVEHKIENKMGMTNEVYCSKMVRLGIRQQKEMEKNFLEDTMKLLAKHWPTFWD